jgi:hypothetical protein
MGTNGGSIGSGIGAIGGAAIGSAILPGIGGVVGGAVGSLAGGLIGSMLSPTKLITDLQASNSSYGNPLPILYGTARLPGTQIWQTQISEKSSGLFKGGLLGGASVPQQSAAFAFCEGPANFQKIWLDGILFFDATQPQAREISNHTFAIRTYYGTEDQLPDFQISQWVSQNVIPGNASPAYRGVCYMVMEGVSLINYGARFPMVTVSWSTSTVETTQFAALTPLSPDISTDISLGGQPQPAEAVDWVRRQAYQMSFDGTVRVYNLLNGACIMTATQATMFAGTAALLTNPPRAPPDPGSLGTMVCGQGGDLYICSGIIEDPSIRIWWVDPTSLNILKEIILTDGHGVVGISDFSDPIPSGAIWSLQAWTVPSMSTGPADYLVGSYFGNPDYAVFLCNPQNGDTWNIALTHNGGQGTATAIGNMDSSGETEIWFCNFNVFDDTVSMYVSSVHVQGINVTATRPTVVLNHTTFGQPALTAAGGALLGLQFLVDPVDGCLIFLNLPYPGAPTAKWNPTTNATVWISSFVTIATPATNCNLQQGMLASPFFNGTLGVPLLNTATGAVTYSPMAAADVAKGGTGYGGLHYDSYTNTMVFWAGDLGMMVAYPQCNTTSEVAVGAIIADLCARVGVTADMIDVSQVTATTIGYVVKDSKSAGAAIADLCNTYLIDMVESDYKLQFIPRGQPVVATITQADLGSIDNNDSSQFWQVKSAQELELPLQITVKYSDPALDYQPGSAAAKRTALPVATQFSKRKIIKDLPVVATNQEARQIAENWLYTMWASRDTFETVLGLKYVWLDPTDNLTVVLDNGDTTTVRIENIDTGADLSLKLSLAAEDISVYAPTTSPGVVYGAKPQALTPSTFAQLLQFNVPLLQDADGAPPGQIRIYTAAGASVAGWRGGGIYRSTDMINWTDYAPAPSGANWGHALTALADTVAKFSTDHRNSVRVILVSGSTLPSSCAYIDLMSGANAALLGQEIIQFQTVVDNEDGSLTLSDLVRSRRGTDWATGTHQVGELFVLLQLGFIAAHALTLGEIGQSEGWKLVPFGSTVSQSASSTYKYLGYDLKPYAPINFESTPSGSDLAVSWVRRTRIGGLLIDGIDTVPLNEETEAYEAYVLPSAAARAAFDPTLPATYTRAFLGLTAPGLTYTAAQMTADAFAPATSTLYLVVFQISGVVGRGFPGYQAVPAF